MSTLRLTVYGIMCVGMITLGTSFYAIIRGGEAESTRVPKEWCLIQQLLNDTVTDESPVGLPLSSFIVSNIGWFLLSLLLPLLVYILEWPQCFSLTFWSQHLQQADPSWMIQHILGQCISFGSTEFLRYFLLEPNGRFWQACIPSNSTCLLEKHSYPNESSHTIQLSQLCGSIADTSSSSFSPLSSASLWSASSLSSPPPLDSTHLLSYLLDNLHSLPSEALSGFGCATFVVCHLFYNHPQRFKTPSLLSIALWLIYASLFVIIMVHFYHQEESTFSGLIYSFFMAYFYSYLLFFFTMV